MFPYTLQSKAKSRSSRAGLQFPVVLSPETNLTAVKYFNNTYRHLGQMAQWTGLMVYDTDPY